MVVLPARLLGMLTVKALLLISWTKFSLRYRWSNEVNRTGSGVLLNPLHDLVIRMARWPKTISMENFISAVCVCCVVLTFCTRAWALAAWTVRLGNSHWLVERQLIGWLLTYVHGHPWRLVWYTRVQNRVHARWCARMSHLSASGLI